jgi:3-deoxy-D-manno-octulosonic-acid transferase
MSLRPSQSLGIGFEIYAFVMAQLHRLAPSLLESRAAKGKEDLGRLGERLGDTKYERPFGSLVWFHGVSVGESLSALPVLDALIALRPDLRVLMTTATTTSAEILKRRLPEGVIHQYVPIDTPQAVKAFLDHWRPDLAVFIESDLWPNLLAELDNRRIKRILLSARITQKTYEGWRFIRGLMRGLLEGFALIMAQDKDSLRRLSEMSQTLKLKGIANLKLIGGVLPDLPEARQTLSAKLNNRLVICPNSV